MVTPTGNQQNNCDGMLDSQSLFSLIVITLIFFYLFNTKLFDVARGNFYRK